MPRKPKTTTEAQTALPSIPKELIDQFVKGPMTAEAVHAASAAFKKALIERALGAELGHHLGYPAGAERPEDATNQRNGKSGKTVLTDDDPLRVKIREEGMVRNKAIYLALGILPDGTRDILGLWIENTEGAKFWMKVFSDLKVRGVQDILIAVTDGLKGMPEALGAVFPATTLQTCIVHLIRNSLDYASWKDRRGLAAALKQIYSATGAEAAQAELDAFEQGEWGQKFPTVVAAWRRAWDRVIPFFAFPPAVRKVIYTTNAIESVNARLRKIVKTRGHFPTDEAATKLLWLALRNITADWSRAAHDWKAAMNQFAILYEDRFTRNHL